jgi:hypothetical protein
VDARVAPHPQEAIRAALVDIRGRWIRAQRRR